MLRRHIFLLSLVSAIGFTGTVQATPAVGQQAPDFSLSDTGGKTVRLSDYRGKHVVLEWVNPGCPYVRKHYNSANMQGTQKEVAGKGVVWLAINSTTESHPDYLAPAQLARWMAGQNAVPSNTLMDEDGAVGKAYGARTTPHMYIVNPVGVLVYAGGIDSIPSARADDIKTAVNYVKQSIEDSLAGKPLRNAVTRPYGCSVKYKS
ncbi:MAG: thioredoxin family protein [Rhodoferax sp.]|nr:thioredoxin family protein [Rhodoferax sp.]